MARADGQVGPKGLSWPGIGLNELNNGRLNGSSGDRRSGRVGTAIAFTARNRGVASHLSLYDLDGARATAEMLDLRHGLQFVRPATIDAGDAVSVCTGADVVVITAGAKQRPGETRLALAARNGALSASYFRG